MYSNKAIQKTFKSPNLHEQNIHHENDQVGCNTATNTDTDNVPKSATTASDIENDYDDDMGIENIINDDVSLRTATTIIEVPMMMRN